MLTMIQLEAIRYALVNGQRLDNELVAALFEAYFQALEEALELQDASDGVAASPEASK
jgi:hypothetical protein